MKSLFHVGLIALFIAYSFIPVCHHHGIEGGHSHSHSIHEHEHSHSHACTTSKQVEKKVNDKSINNAHGGCLLCDHYLRNEEEFSFSHSTELLLLEKQFSDFQTELNQIVQIELKQFYLARAPPIKSKEWLL